MPWVRIGEKHEIAQIGQRYAKSGQRRVKRGIDRRMVRSRINRSKALMVRDW